MLKKINQSLLRSKTRKLRSRLRKKKRKSLTRNLKRRLLKKKKKKRNLVIKTKKLTETLRNKSSSSLRPRRLRKRLKRKKKKRRKRKRRKPRRRSQPLRKTQFQRPQTKKRIQITVLIRERLMATHIQMLASAFTSRTKKVSASNLPMTVCQLMFHLQTADKKMLFKSFFNRNKTVFELNIIFKK